LIELEDLKLRKSGLVVFGEVTVEIEGETDLKRVELLSEDIKKAVKKKIENLEHIVVNIKPAQRKNLRLAFLVFDKDGLQAKLSEYLGKAPYFLFIELEQGRVRNWKTLENLFSNYEKKRGIKAVDLIIRKKANVLVVRTVTQGPYCMLRANFVKILRIPDKTGLYEMSSIGFRISKKSQLLWNNMEIEYENCNCKRKRRDRENHSFLKSCPCSLKCTTF
jgi:predicted Fe-Mo cluster-binding NifX family protein